MLLSQAEATSRIAAQLRALRFFGRLWLALPSSAPHRCQSSRRSAAATRSGRRRPWIRYVTSRPTRVRWPRTRGRRWTSFRDRGRTPGTGTPARTTTAAGKRYIPHHPQRTQTGCKAKPSISPPGRAPSCVRPATKADDGPASETEAARQRLGRRPGRRQHLASGIYHIIHNVHGLDARQSLEALARPAAPLAAHSPRPVLVLRCLSCGSCAVYDCRLETQCLDSYLRMGDVVSARCCRLASPPQGRLLSLCPDNYSRG